MKRFIIPALFVIDAETDAEAEEIAGDMQFAANRIFEGTEKAGKNCRLYMDEALPNKVCDIVPDEENPHTYAL